MQIILTSDGDASFAIFIYEGEDYVTVDYQIGVDAGNQRNYTIIQDAGFSPIRRLTAVYSMDGMNYLRT